MHLEAGNANHVETASIDVQATDFPLEHQPEIGNQLDRVSEEDCFATF
jgi:hypothetical protein